MRGMILAAGKGTRLKPLTDEIPKPMVPILGKPVIDYIIENLYDNGFDEIMINLNYKAKLLKRHIESMSTGGCKIDFSIEPVPLGTAGGVKVVEGFFKDTFLVIGGDDLTDINIKDVVKFHKKKRAIATIALSQVKDVEQYGVVVIDRLGKIVEFQEKPDKEEAKSNWINTGIYIFEPEIFNYIPIGEFFDFGLNLFPFLKEKKLPFYGYKAAGYWRDIGNVDEYKQAQFDMLEGRVHLELPGTEFWSGVRIGENVKLSQTVDIKGPVFIGDHTDIYDNVSIHGPAIIGKSNIIKDRAVISNSVTWDYNLIKPGSRISNCVLGEFCVTRENETLSDVVRASSELRETFAHKYSNQKESAWMIL